MWIIHIILVIFLFVYFMFLQFFFTNNATVSIFVTQLVRTGVGLSFFVYDSLFQDMISLIARSLSLILNNTEPGAFYMVGKHWYFNE